MDEPGGKLKGPTSRDYETVGYVISGSANLDLEGQTLNLKAGDSWLVFLAEVDHCPSNSEDREVQLIARIPVLGCTTLCD